MVTRVISESIPEDNTGSIGIGADKIDRSTVDLEAKEEEWEKEGKSPRKKAYLRYYYRNRSKYVKGDKNPRVESTGIGLIDL